MRILPVALLLALAAPAAARAGDATIASRALPVGGERTSAAARAPARFDLLGLHWQGSGRVLFRTQGLSGRWSRWRVADTDGSRSGRWRLGNPYWVAPSDRLEYRLAGRVRRLRAYYVWSPVEAVPARTLTIADSPAIVPRVGWSANNRILRRPPRYAPAIHFAVVHHTAGTNAYGPAASAAIVRGIELYHVKGNGWNDIGYNFLVDRYGQVFEGRLGGITRNVVGAHAEGFNYGSVGIAVIGNYSSQPPPAAALASLEKLLAWRLDLAHVDPLSTLTWLSGGNPRFPVGAPVFLRAVSGHRDTGFTDCPGGALYRLLPRIAHAATAIGLPKLYSPDASGKLGGPIRFSARLSSAETWTVTVTASTGQVAAKGTGFGTLVDWTWSSAGAAPGRYVWTIEAGPDVRPARGVVGKATVPPPPPPPTPTLLTELTLSPPAISPNGDGFADSTTISYTLSAKASVTATITDASGAAAATLFTAQRQSARRQSFPYSGEALADGNYVLTIDALADDGREVRSEASLTVDRTLSAVTASPSPLSPGGSLSVTFNLAKPAQVTVTVNSADKQVAVLFQGQLEPGSQSYSWDGTAAGAQVEAGTYAAVVTATDDIATITQSASFDVGPGA
jgi:hypothetical protein